MIDLHPAFPRSARLRSVALAALTMLSLLCLPAAVHAGGGPPSHPATPATEGPVTAAGGTRPVPESHARVDLAGRGYAEEEYFISGTAKAYGASLPRAAYKTRVLVRRPTAARRFNGTVVVEWLNVSSGFDSDPVWIEAHQELLREGYAWVGVSAQAVGVQTGPLALRTWDPVRYGSLAHPGDAYAHDVFSQAIRAVGSGGPRRRGLLGGRRARQIMAVGKSQSAILLHQYIDLGVHEEAGVVDGFLLDEAGPTTYAAHLPTAPTLHLLSESEVAGPFGDLSGPGPGPASRWYRQWHVAGASHVVSWTVGPHGYLPLGDPTSTAVFDPGPAGEYGQIDPAATVCDPNYTDLSTAGRNRFPKRYALDAAIDALTEWMSGGAPAPQPPRFAFDASGAIVRDALGNASAGLRLPVISVPLARYAGNACGLFGSTYPFDRQQLTQLYPTFEAYRSRLRAAVHLAVAQRLLRPADAADLLDRAQDARARWQAD